MIVFDLRCEPEGHVFEAWFGSNADYDDQRRRGLVTCALCGTLEVEKAVMAPNLHAASEASSGGEGGTKQGPAPQLVKEMLAAMAAAQKQLLGKSDYVGDRFATEARAIHLGEADPRSIYGKATPDETRSLREDGIEVAPLPFPVVLPSQEN
jgi:hypothetical protein